MKSSSVSAKTESPAAHRGAKSHGVRRTTAADVARRAGVQQASVSVVLNGAKSSTTVSEAARKRILCAARELNYHPSASARALVTGRTMQIAFVANASVWSHLHIHHMTELHGLMMTVARGGYRLLILPPVEAHEPTRVAEIAQAGDALCVLAPDFAPEFFVALQASGTPFVVLGNPGNVAVPRLDQDNYAQTFASVEWLAARGHRNIMLVHPLGVRGKALAHCLVINRAYADAIEKCGGTATLIEPETQLSRAEIAALARTHSATAIITRGLPVTTEWHAALEEDGKRVPDDVTLLAHLSTDELEYSERCGQAHGLACLIHDQQENGRRAGEVLLGALKGTAPDKKPILLPGLGPCWHSELKILEK